VLGDPNRIYYDDGVRKNSGRKDYALITDFDVDLDAITLKGNLSNFIFKAEKEELQFIGITMEFEVGVVMMNSLLMLKELIV
jgi:hypothetical protein